jgi:hypothetical protein
MAKSPLNDMMDIVIKIFGGAHAIEMLTRAFRGEVLPEGAPLAAKMASGLFQSGDEAIQYLLLQSLGKQYPDKRARVERFLVWMRRKGGAENSLTSLLSWYYFNGFRVKLAKIKEASTPDSKADLGVEFLSDIADIIGDKPDQEESNYAKVEDFLKLSGVPVMPSLDFINKFKNWVLGFSQRIAAYDASFQEKYEEVEQENAKKGPVKRFLLKLIGQPVGEAPKKPKAEGGGLFGRGKPDNKATQSTTVSQTVNGGNIINYFSSGEK